MLKRTIKRAALTILTYFIFWGLVTWLDAVPELIESLCLYFLIAIYMEFIYD